MIYCTIKGGDAPEKLRGKGSLQDELASQIAAFFCCGHFNEGAMEEIKHWKLEILKQPEHNLLNGFHKEVSI